MVRRKIFYIVLLLIGGGLALSLAWKPLFVYLWTTITVRDVSDAKNRLVILLYKTDHYELLRACRELASKYKLGDLESRRYDVGWWEGDPKARSFPEAILAIHPSYIEIYETGRIRVEMVGGYVHFGVVAYPEGYQKAGYEQLGNKELIPGLWYYDDGYHEDPNYEQIIQSLKPKG